MTDFFLLKAFITEKYFSFFLEDNIQTSVVCKRLAPGYACARKWRMTQETGDITDGVLRHTTNLQLRQTLVFLWAFIEQG